MPHKVLFIMTGSDHWTLKDGTRHPTGFWAEEAVAPLEILKDAGVEVTVATPGGVRPPVDQGSLTAERTGSEEAAAHIREVVETAPEFQAPVALSDVRVDDYDAIFVPGGHGPMEDLAADSDAGKALLAADKAHDPIAIVCHGPAILLSAADADGANAFAGRTITAFTNDEEEQGGLADQASWLLEDRLTDAGLDVVVGEPWVPHVQVDGNLLTGQNPASSAPLAKVLLERLGKGSG
ncbi:type 1 glutamine amidotransferase domain-containing protein [Gordonia sp. CPCC 206044]|uniref:type 1 glutamine amidotransferase domain-containing protein n=1 Tax=Gordonia sp. CPCC 206044 TaxID=3140793 RepID=UPI003AF3F0C6